MNQVELVYTGDNVDSFKEALSDYRVIKDEDQLIVVDDSQILFVIEKNDRLLIDMYGNIHITSSDFGHRSEKDEAVTDDSLREILRPFVEAFNEEKNETSNRFKDIAKRMKEETTNKAKELHFYGETFKESLKQKHAARQQKEDALFNRLRDNASYNGLSDQELRRVVKSRIFFDQD